MCSTLRAPYHSGNLLLQPIVVYGQGPGPIHPSFSISMLDLVSIEPVPVSLYSP